MCFGADRRSIRILTTVYHHKRAAGEPAVSGRSGDRTVVATAEPARINSRHRLLIAVTTLLRKYLAGLTARLSRAARVSQIL